MKGASLKKLFSPLSCAPMEQNPYQIPDEGKKSCNFLPLNMLAGGLAAQLASHKQQWHNNDSNNNSNDNNDRNYDKNHNTAVTTDAVANLFFEWVRLTGTTALQSRDHRCHKHEGALRNIYNCRSHWECHCCDNMIKA